MQGYYYGGVKGAAAIKTYLVPGRYVDSASDLDAGAIGKRGGGAGNVTALDERRALAAIKSGEAYHTNITALIGKWATAGVFLPRVATAHPRGFERR